MRLENKVVLITGAGSGMGREVALLFAQEGARLVLNDLIPETVDVTPRQMAVLEEAEPLLADLGVIIERFGPNTVAVQGSPTILKNAPAAEFVAELLDLCASHSHGRSREELLHHVLDMMACKAAVKAGDPLADEEITALLAQRLNVPRSGNCPHGRPTTITLSKEQLEKQFKRT